MKDPFPRTDASAPAPGAPQPAPRTDGPARDAARRRRLDCSEAPGHLEPRSAAPPAAAARPPRVDCEEQ